MTTIYMYSYLLEICQKSVDDLIEFDTDGSWHSISKSNSELP